MGCYHMPFRLPSFILAFLPILCLLRVASAQSPQELADQLKALQDAVAGLQQTVATQQQQIDTLTQQNDQLKTQVETTPPAPASPELPAAPKATQSSTPEIGAVVDVVARLSQSKEDEDGNDRLAVRELELTLGHDVDPFTRLDATLSFSDFEEASLEEAYLTYMGLPYELVLRAGRYKPKVGKAAAIHPDQLDTVDEPLVVQRYLGVEGYTKTGAELARFLPQFADSLTQELTLGVVEGGSGEGGQMFGETRRRPTYYAHLKNYWELGDTSSLELGATYLRGSRDEDAKDEVNALGLDFTLTHFVTPVNKLKLQSELYYQHRDETLVFDNPSVGDFAIALANDLGQLTDNVGAIVNGDTPEYGPLDSVGAATAGLFSRYNANPLGYYALLDYRLSPRFGVGARYDYVEPVTYLPYEGKDPDQAVSAYLTFYQSEFARLRMQYQYFDSGTGEEDNRFFLQGTYAIGIHKHQLK